MRRVVLAAVVTLGLVAGIAVSASGALAPVGLALIDQSPTVGPEGTFDVRLRIEGTPATDDEFAIDVHPAVTDRVSLRASLAGSPVPAVVNRKPIVIPIATAVPDSAGETTLTVTVTEQRPPSGSDAIRITKTGVYPVTITLRDADGNALAMVQTAMVRLAATPITRPFPVALGVTVRSPQLFGVDLTAHIDQAILDKVAGTTAALSANPTTPVLVAPSPELVDALAREPLGQSLLTDLDRALAGHEVSADTYVPIDAPAFLAHNLGGELDTQLAAGEAALHAGLPSIRPDRRTWIPSGPVDEATLGRLQTLGVHQLVIPSAALEPANGEAATPFRPVEVTTSGGSIPTAVVDPDLQRAFALDVPPNTGALRLYLELAFIAMEHPDVEEGAVVAPPDGVDLSVAFLTQFVSLVQRGTLLTPVSVDEYFRLTRPAVDTDGEPVVRTLRSVSNDALGPYAAEVFLLRIDALSTSAMVPGRKDMPARIERLVLLADRLGLADSDRASYLDAAHEPLNKVKTLVTVIDQGTVTLTSGSDEIPYRIISSASEPVTVMIRLSSTKLAFPDSTRPGRLDLATTLQPGATDFTVRVKTQARATFPMTIEIRTPDGNELLDSSKVTIRSTALSGVGIALTIGAALTLIIWWLRHHYTRRRADRAATRSQHPSGFAEQQEAPAAASSSLTRP